MKKNILFLVLTSMTLYKIYAQSFNFTMSTSFSDPNLYNTCPTFANSNQTYVPNWYLSHGTPQIFNYSPNPNILSMNSFLSSNFLYGEGAFGVLGSSSFIQGYIYSISFDYYMTTTNMSANVLATSQLIPYTSIEGQCADLKQSITNYDIIASINTPSQINVWNHIVINYHPTNNYSQIWFYPSTINTFNSWLNIKNINIESISCSASNTTIYNNGLIPSGTILSNNFNIGTSFGGSTTVTNSVSNITELLATNTIDIKNSFAGVASCGGSNNNCPYLRFGILNCNNTGREINPNKINDYTITNYPFTEDDKKLMNEITNNNVGIDNSVNKIKSIITYPNPSKGLVNIELPNNINGNWKVIISNIMGKTILEKFVGSNENKFPLSINGSSGVYLIKLINSSTGYQEVQKVIIQK